MKYFLKGILGSLLLFTISCGEDDGPTPMMDTNQVVVEFSANTASGSELTGENLPVLILTGTVEGTSTVTIAESSNAFVSAQGNGVDYTFNSPQVVPVPPGVYDGTVATGIAIPTLEIVDDDLEEGTESFSLVLQSANGDLVVGNVNSFTYSIIDNESASIAFSQAFGSDKESVGGNLPRLFISGELDTEKTVTISSSNNGDAELGVDYLFDGPLQVTIPAGSYDGTLNSSIPIDGLEILDDQELEPQETIVLELSEPSEGLLLGATSVSTYAIEGVFFCEGGMADEYPCDGFDLISLTTLDEMSATSSNDVWGWKDSTTNKEYALVGLNNGTAFIDISGDEPIYLGKLPTATASSTWRDVKIYGDYAFVVAEAAGHGMQVFDLTKLRDVTNPPQTFNADTRYTDIGNAHNIVINEAMGYAYPVGTDRGDAFSGGVHFVDIQDPLNPTGVGGYGANGYTHDAQVVTYNGPDSDYSGSEIFIGANEDQIAIVDITNKSNPIEISTLGYSQLGYTHQGWFTEDQRFFILGDELDEINFGFNSRTLVFDLQDLDNPLLHTSYTGPTSAIDHNGYVVGNEYYLANYTAGIRLIDLSDIVNENLAEVGFFDTFPQSDIASFDGVWSLYPYFESGRILVNDINSGLFVLQKSE